MWWHWVKTIGGWLWKPFALIGVLLAARALVRSQDNRISNLKDALAVEKEKRKVTAHEERIKILTEQTIAKGRQSLEVGKQIRESKRKVVAIESGKPTEDMTDAQIAIEFSKLRL
jgi:hypothetical protein